MKKIQQISGIIALIILINAAFYFIFYKPANSRLLNNGNTNSSTQINSTLPRINSTILGNDGKSIYFSKVVLSDNKEYTDFGFLNLIGNDKNVLTMIVPDVDETTAKIFQGELKLVGAKNDIIYFITPDDKLYELPVFGTGDQGGAPKLVSEIK